MRNLYFFINLLFLKVFCNIFIQRYEGQQITVGPVIGLVTENSARILIEFTQSGNETVYLKKQGDIEYSFSLEKNVETDTPIIFEFKGLERNTKYEIHFETPHIISSSGIRSRFRTLNGDLKSGKFRIGVVSCNDYTIDKENHELNIWKSIEKKVKNEEIDFMLHIGDQIYTDMADGQLKMDLSTFKIAKRRYSENFIENKEEIRELIRNNYRKTWTKQHTAEVLSLVPNLMVLDDHEIYDDFGFVKFNEGTFEYFFALQARYCYYQYQRQLREDIDFENYENVKNEFFSGIINQVALFMFEYRSHRVWENEFSPSYLGFNQQKKFEQNFAIKGDFEEAKSAIIVSTIPLFLWGREYIEFYAKLDENLNDYLEYWVYQNEHSLIYTLDYLRQWKERNKQRNLLFVGGDIHSAGNSEIYFKKKPFAKQIITSGVSQYCDWRECLTVQGINQLSDSFSKDYCFIHHDWRYSHRNYAVIEISVDSNGNSEITTEIISNMKNEGKNIHNSNNFPFQEWTRCCGDLRCKIKFVIDNNLKVIILLLITSLTFARKNRLFFLFFLVVPITFYYTALMTKN